MQVFPLIVAFSLKTDGSGRVVPTKGKHPKIKTSSYSRRSCNIILYLLMLLRLFIERREIITTF